MRSGKREKTNVSEDILVDRLCDDDTMAAGSWDAVLWGILLEVGAVRVIWAAAGSTTVKLDAVTSTGDSVALARAVGGDWGWGRAVWAGWAGAEGWDIWALRVVIRVRVGVIIEGLGSEAGVDGLKSSLLVLAGNDVGGLAWALGHWAADGSWGNWATLWDSTGLTAGSTLISSGAGLWGWYIEGVELAASGWLSGELAGWVMGDLITIEHVVEPVALTWDEERALEAERSWPWAGLGAGLGKGDLALVTVPGTDEVNSLDISGGAESERELSSGHFDKIEIGGINWLIGIKKCDLQISRPATKIMFVYLWGAPGSGENDERERRKKEHSS
jgi:hypothetical protein